VEPITYAESLARSTRSWSKIEFEDRGQKVLDFRKYGVVNIYVTMTYFYNIRSNKKKIYIFCPIVCGAVLKARL